MPTTFTTISLVTPLDLAPEELDDGDRSAFVLKTNSGYTKLTSWTAALSASISSINAMGGELSTALSAWEDISPTLLAKAGGTMTGNLFIQKSYPVLTLDATTDISWIAFARAGTPVGYLTNYANRMDLEYGATARFRLYASYAQSTVPIYSVDTVTADTGTILTTKSYVDTFLPKTGGTLTDDLSITADSAGLYLDASGVSNPRVSFYRDGLYDAGITSFDSRFEIVRGANSLNFYDDVTISNQPMRASPTLSGDNSNTLTTKSYVDGKLAKEGGTLIGDLTLDQTGAPQLIFKRSGVQTGQLYAASDRMELQSLTNTWIRLWVDHLSVSHRLSGITTVPGDTSDTLTTKGYVDALLLATDELNDLIDVSGAPIDGQALMFSAGNGWIPATLNTSGGITDHGGMTGLGDDDHLHYHTDARGDARYVGKTGPQTIAGDLLVTEADDCYLTLNSDNSVPLLTMNVASQPVGRLQMQGDFTLLRHVHSLGGIHTELKLHDDYAQMNTVLRGITPVGSTDLTTKAYVDSNFLSVDGDQDITGDKVFINNLTVEGEDTQHSKVRIKALNTKEASTLYYRDNAIESAVFSLHYTTLFRRYAAGANSEFKINDDSFAFNKVVTGITPTTGSHLTTKAYVDALALSREGGVMTGSLFIDKPTADSSGFVLSVAGVDYSSMLCSPAGTLVNHYVPGGPAGDTQLLLTDTSISVNRVLRGITPVGSTDLTTKAYVDTFLPLAGGTLSDNFRVLSAAPYLTVENVGGNGNSHVQFKTGGVPRALMYWEDTNQELRLRTYASNGTSVTTELIMDSADGVIVSSVPIVTPDPVDANHLATKSYVDTFVPKSGGTMTGFLQCEFDNAAMYIDASNSTSARLYLQLDTVNAADFWALDTYSLLRHYKRATTGDNRIKMFDTHTEFDHDVRVATMGTNVKSLATKEYVDSGSGGGSIGTKDFWTGTQAAYDALGSYDANTIYFASA